VTHEDRPNDSASPVEPSLSEGCGDGVEVGGEFSIRQWSSTTRPVQSAEGHCVAEGPSQPCIAIARLPGHEFADALAGQILAWAISNVSQVLVVVPRVEVRPDLDKPSWVNLFGSEGDESRHGSTIARSIDARLVVPPAVATLPP